MQAERCFFYCRRKEGEAHYEELLKISQFSRLDKLWRKNRLHSAPPELVKIVKHLKPTHHPTHTKKTQKCAIFDALWTYLLKFCYYVMLKDDIYYIFIYIGPRTRCC